MAIRLTLFQKNDDALASPAHPVAMAMDLEATKYVYKVELQ